MSVTNWLGRNKTRLDDGVAASITIDAVPLFTANTHDQAFGTPMASHIGDHHSRPIPLQWDARATWLTIGHLNNIAEGPTHVTASGVVMDVGQAEAAMRVIEQAHTKVWVVPEICTTGHSSTVVAGRRVITGWYVSAIMLTCNPQRILWPGELTTISIQRRSRRALPILLATRATHSSTAWPFTVPAPATPHM